MKKRACELLEGAAQSVVRDAINFVLYHQYITSHALSDPKAPCPRIWQVCKGSGMGFNASGEISDAAFFVDYERDFILKPEARQNPTSSVMLGFVAIYFSLLPELVDTFPNSFMSGGPMNKQKTLTLHYTASRIPYSGNGLSRCYAI